MAEELADEKMASETQSIRGNPTVALHYLGKMPASGNLTSRIVIV